MSMISKQSEFHGDYDKKSPEATFEPKSGGKRSSSPIDCDSKSSTTPEIKKQFVKTTPKKLTKEFPPSKARSTPNTYTDGDKVVAFPSGKKRKLPSWMLGSNKKTDSPASSKKVPKKSKKTVPKTTTRPTRKRRQKSKKIDFDSDEDEESADEMIQAADSPLPPPGGDTEPTKAGDEGREEPESDATTDQEKEDGDVTSKVVEMVDASINPQVTGLSKGDVTSEAVEMVDASVNPQVTDLSKGDDTATDDGEVSEEEASILPQSPDKVDPPMSSPPRKEARRSLDKSDDRTTDDGEASEEEASILPQDPDKIDPPVSSPPRKEAPRSLDKSDDMTTDNEEASILPQDPGKVDTPVNSGSATSTSREPCSYGSSCYRKNPIHFQECSHPGDADYKEADDLDDSEKPECPYGTSCYRKNLKHKKKFKHTKRVAPKRAAKIRAARKKRNESSSDEYDLDDSFLDDEEEEEDLDLSDEDSDWDPSQGSQPQKATWKSPRSRKKKKHHDAESDDETTDDEEDFDDLVADAKKFAGNTKMWKK